MSKNSTFSIILNAGSRRFIARTELGLTGEAAGVAVADFNRDGIKDLATGVYVSNLDNVAVFFGKPDGGFGKATYLEELGNNIPTDIVADDFNRDGWPDLAVSIFSPGDSMRVFINKRDETFYPSVIYEAAGNP